MVSERTKRSLSAFGMAVAEAFAEEKFELA